METHNLHTLHTILSTGSPLKAQSYEYVYRCIKSSVLLGSISGRARSSGCRRKVGREVWGGPWKPWMGVVVRSIITVVCRVTAGCRIREYLLFLKRT